MHLSPLKHCSTTINYSCYNVITSEEPRAQLRLPQIRLPPQFALRMREGAYVTTITLASDILLAELGFVLGGLPAFAVLLRVLRALRVLLVLICSEVWLTNECTASTSSNCIIITVCASIPLFLFVTGIKLAFWIRLRVHSTLIGVNPGC